MTRRVGYARVHADLRTVTGYHDTLDSSSVCYLHCVHIVFALDTLRHDRGLDRGHQPLYCINVIIT